MSVLPTLDPRDLEDDEFPFRATELAALLAWTRGRIDRAGFRRWLRSEDLASGITPVVGYRIRPWRRVGLLLRRSDGWRELDASLCLHPEELYSSSDEVVGMWLRLRFAERETLAAANLHGSAA